LRLEKGRGSWYESHVGAVNNVSCATNHGAGSSAQNVGVVWTMIFPDACHPRTGIFEFGKNGSWRKEPRSQVNKLLSSFVMFLFASSKKYMVLQFGHKRKYS